MATPIATGANPYVTAGQLLLGGAGLLFGESDEDRRRRANAIIERMRNRAISRENNRFRVDRTRLGRESRNAGAGRAAVLERIQQQAGTFGSSAGMEQLQQANMSAAELLNSRLGGLESGHANRLSQIEQAFQPVLPNINQGTPGQELFATGVANALESNSFESLVRQYFGQMNAPKQNKQISNQLPFLDSGRGAGDFLLGNSRGVV